MPTWNEFIDLFTWKEALLVLLTAGVIVAAREGWHINRWRKSR